VVLHHGSGYFSFALGFEESGSRSEGGQSDKGNWQLMVETGSENYWYLERI